MGYNSYTYIGPYIRIDNSDDIEYKENRVGCKKCNTVFVENYCSKCGSKRSTYEVNKKLKSRSCSHICMEVLVNAYPELNVRGVLNKIVTSTHDNSIIPDIRNVGKHFDNECDTNYILDVTKVDTQIEIVKLELKEILSKFNDMGFKVDVVYGLVVYSS